MAEALYEEHQFPLDQRFAVGFSGGADSMALLLGLCDAVGEWGGSTEQITVLHFNHAVSTEADRWQAHCAEVCERCGVAFVAGIWDKNSEVAFTESLAREARYQWFDRIVADDQVLLLGHHADDQVETVLLHLFQGREINRITGMPERRFLMRGGERELCRPLIGFSGQSLREFLERQGEVWVEDSSNQSLAHDRNFLRHSVLPLLHQHWPQVSNSVLRVARKLEKLEAAWQGEAKLALRSAMSMDAQRLFCLIAPIEAAQIVGFQPFKFAAMIRQWVHLADKPAPSDSQVSQLYGDLLRWQTNEIGLERCRLAWGGVEIRGHHDCLYLVDADVSQLSGDIAIGTRQLSKNLNVEWKDVVEGGLPSSVLNNSASYWRWRDGGEKVTLQNREHCSGLKKLLQERGIPQWERQRLPYLVVNSEIVWVWGLGVMKAGLCLDDEQRQVLPRFIYGDN